METATLYSRGNGILCATTLLIKCMDILKIFLDSQGLMFSKWPVVAKGSSGNKVLSWNLGFWVVAIVVYLYR